MKKIVSSVLMLSAFVINAAPQFKSHPSLVGSIQRSAEKWINHCNEDLGVEQQLAYLNLFCLIMEQQSDVIMKCIEHIQKDDSFVKVSKLLGTYALEHIESYVKVMQKRFADCNKSTEENMKQFDEKLERKINELSELIYSIYYTSLYKNIQELDGSSLYYMFDNRGIIPLVGRTKLLPVKLC